jgi:hypothetical protein
MARPRDQRREARALLGELSDSDESEAKSDGSAPSVGPGSGDGLLDDLDLVLGPEPEQELVQWVAMAAPAQDIVDALGRVCTLSFTVAAAPRATRAGPGPGR